ncbi:MAG: type II toxin-antitoxin system VapC family toxin [Planctomycetes bacterium]|nr:type II toxin-antitoxin system VapC family toxin [Planctomycetota bacterium]
MMKSTVYLETSVISYLTARPSRDLVIAAHQQITRDWWDNILPQYMPCISIVVLEEASQGDPNAARLRMEKLAEFPVLDLMPDVQKPAEMYFTAIGIPEKARADAYHLAFAAWHGVDYLLSWNCTHIVAERVRRIVEGVNTKFGIQTPVIYTPKKLMEIQHHANRSDYPRAS